MKNIIVDIKKKLNEPLTQFMLKFLVREGQYHWGRKPFGALELKYLTQALVSQNLFGVDGKMVSSFEQEFAALYEVPYAVASTSGTAAIHTALGVLDLNPGDEVITAPITDLGTVIPILSLNAIPVFADIDQSYNMDPQDVERKITNRTKAIVVVHLFGNPCQMDAMVDIARRHKIPLIEDCSQSHVTQYKGKYVGTIGDIGCFSFQQSKHMTTGDGGMTITSNKAYYERMKLFVDKGFARKGWGARAYAFHAPNYRMNELTAAVGRAQLTKVKSVVATRQAMGALMTRLLSDVSGLTTAPITDGAKHSYWLYPVFVKAGNVEQFAQDMTAAKFWCAGGYTGKPIYLCSESLTAKKTYGTSQFPFHPAFASRSYEYKEGLCPRAEETLKHLVTMPWDESWGEEKVQRAAEAFILLCSSNGSMLELRSNDSSRSRILLRSTSRSIANAKKNKNTLHRLNPSVVVAENSASVQSVTLVNESNREDKNITAQTRIGIIGCGQMGKWHCESYRKIDNVQLVALVDTDASRARSLTDKISANVYTDYRTMIEKEKLDGVSVCTVPSSHYDIVMNLLNAGIHVLCEKPLAVSVEQAERMTQNAREKNKLLLSAFKFRFFDEVQKAKELLDSKSFGRVLSFRLMIGGQTDMAGTWFANPDVSGGGVIIDNGPHAFDLVRYLLGEIISVQTQTMTVQNLNVEDTAQIICRLADGATGVIDLSWSNPLPSKSYLEIYTQEGVMLLDLSGLSYKFKTWGDFKRVENQTSMNEAFIRQLNHFVQAIKGKGSLVTNVDDGLKVQIMVDQAYRNSDKSYKEGRKSGV